MTAKDELFVDGWKVTDLPVPYTEADYEEARAELAAQAKNTPELGAVFEYGYIPKLGISDMDFWVVFPDDAEKMYVAVEPRLTRKTKHVMMHETILMSEKHYKKMLYFDPWTTNIWPNGHRLIYQNPNIKRDLNFEKIVFQDDELKALSLSYLEEFVLTVVSLALPYAKRELKVRSIFENIKSSVYIMREANKLKPNSIVSSFAEDFEALRKNWFELEEGEAIRKLIPIFEEGLRIGYQAAFIMAEWLEAHGTKRTPKECGIQKTGAFHTSPLDGKYKNVYVNTYKDRRVYTDSVKTPEEAMKMTVNSYKKLELKLGSRSKSIDFFTLFLPLGLSGTILGLASRKGLLSDSLKRDIYTNADEFYVFEHPKFLEKTKFVNEITENYNKKQVPGTHGKGWPSGNNRFGYTFEREKLRRKLLTFWLHWNFWRRLGQIT